MDTFDPFALLPAWLAWPVIAAFLAAKLAVNVFPTPAAGSPWRIPYRVAEVLAMIGRRAKERPDEAARLLKAVDAVRSGSGVAKLHALSEIADVAEGLTGKPKPTRPSGPPPALGFAFALLLGGSLLLSLPACSTVHELTPAERLELAEMTYTVSSVAIDAYAGREDADPDLVWALLTARDAARAALDRAHLAVEAGDPALWPVAMAAATSAAAELAARVAGAGR